VPFGQAGEPKRLWIEALGVDALVLAYTADEAKLGRDGLTGEPCYRDGVIVCVDPPLAEVVYWQRGGLDGVANGDTPGLESNGTVYLYGHAGATGAVFNALPSLNPGDTTEVATVNGVITYRVEDVFTVSKRDYPTDPRVTEQAGGRLLLVSCDHSGGAPVAKGGYAVNNVVARLQAESAGPLPGG
jgi:LPXTG-site transpeptidase (sortase) family protein